MTEPRPVPTPPRLTRESFDAAYGRAVAASVRGEALVRDALWRELAGAAPQLTALDCAGIRSELEQRADEADALADRIERSPGHQTPVEAQGWRTHADKVRRWAKLLEAAPASARQQLTALDRADVYRELEEAAEHHEAYASVCGDRGSSFHRPGEAPQARARAQRVRQLMELVGRGTP